LRTGALSTAGSAVAPPLRAWLADTIAAAARAPAPAGPRYGTVWGPGSGAGAGTVAVFAVKSVRYNGFAAHDAPLAVYGVVTCPAAFARVLAGVLQRHPL